MYRTKGMNEREHLNNSQYGRCLENAMFSGCGVFFAIKAILNVEFGGFSSSVNNKTSTP